MKQRVATLLVCFILLLCIIFAITYYRKSTRNAIEKFASNNVMINILIAGNNIFNDNKHRFFVIFSFNPENKKAGLTFVPPDYSIYMNGPNKPRKKIQDVETYDFSKVTEALGNELKINIPFYIILYSPDIRIITDMLEGVELYIMDQASEIYGLHYGVNYLDGNKVLQYINSGNSSIFGKYDRIMDILLSLYHERDKYKKIISIDFVSEIAKNIKTNIMPQEFSSLFELLNDDKTDISTTILPGFYDDGGYYAIDDISYKMYKNSFLKKLITEEKEDSSIKVKILNGTDVPGLARKVRAMLVKDGLNVVEFGTSPYPAMDKTIIINRKGDLAPVRRVAKLLGVDTIYHVIDSSQLNNVLLITGKDMIEKFKVSSKKK